MTVAYHDCRSADVACLAVPAGKMLFSRVIILTLLTIGCSHRSRYHQHPYVSFVSFPHTSSSTLHVIVLYSLTRVLETYPYGTITWGTSPVRLGHLRD
jgi:hypothetical protein